MSLGVIVSTYSNTVLKDCPVWITVNNEELHSHCGLTDSSADIINMYLYQINDSTFQWGSVIASGRGFKIQGTVEIVVKVTLWRTSSAGKGYSWTSFQDLLDLVKKIKKLNKSVLMTNNKNTVWITAASQLRLQHLLWLSAFSVSYRPPSSQPLGLDALITHYTLQKTPSDRLFQRSLHNHGLNSTNRI